MNLTNVMALVPGLGAAFRDPAAPKSEYDLACAGIAAILAVPDVTGLVRVAGIAVIVAAYVWSRTQVKSAAPAVVTTVGSN